MKRTIVLVLALVLAPLAGAQLYKYTDPKTGKTVYSDQPPADVDSKTLNVKGGGGPAAKSAVEQDKALDKGRRAAIEIDAAGERGGEGDGIRARAAGHRFDIG